MRSGRSAARSGCLFGGQAFPFRAADGAEENRLRVAATLQRVRRQRVVELVDGRAADGVFLRVDGEAESFRGGVEDVEADGHDFGADAVAGQDGDFVGVAHKEGKQLTELTKFYQD